MNRGRVRLLAGAVWLLAMAVLLVGYAPLEATPVVPAACCQECEQKELACNKACEDASHALEGDSLQKCADDCYSALYEGVGACWAHCVYCTPPAPVDNQCRVCIVGHWEMVYPGNPPVYGPWQHNYDCWSQQGSCP